MRVSGEEDKTPCRMERIRSGTLSGYDVAQGDLRVVHLFNSSDDGDAVQRFQPAGGPLLLFVGKMVTAVRRDGQWTIIPKRAVLVEAGRRGESSR